MARSELNAVTVRTALELRRAQELIAQEAEACQASFRLFAAKAWPVIEPVTSDGSMAGISRADGIEKQR